MMIFFVFQGLRVAAVLGCLGTCLGAWIKVFSVDPSLFYVSFIGQSVVATSQVSFMFELCNEFFKYSSLHEILQINLFQMPQTPVESQIT